MSTNTYVRSATSNDLPQISAFLRENALPTNGVESCVENFVIAVDRDGSWIGISGSGTLWQVGPVKVRGR